MVGKVNQKNKKTKNWRYTLFNCLKVDVGIGNFFFSESDQQKAEKEEYLPTSLP
jgi:hypothetical protein